MWLSSSHSVLQQEPLPDPQRRAADGGGPGLPGKAEVQPAHGERHADVAEYQRPDTALLGSQGVEVGGGGEGKEESPRSSVPGLQFEDAGRGLSKGPRPPHHPQVVTPPPRFYIPFVVLTAPQ